jgi:hypothetical protein
MANPAPTRASPPPRARNSTLRALLLVAAAAAAAAAASVRGAAMHLGVDISTPVPAAAAACMKAQHNIDFAISRAWFSDGEGFDRSAVESGASFKAAGVAFDVYMFPCSFGLAAASQVEQLMANLSAASVQFGTIWFDEPGPEVRVARQQDSELRVVIARARARTHARAPPPPLCRRASPLAL